jgi:hypothetical protein
MALTPPVPHNSCIYELIRFMYVIISRSINREVTSVKCRPTWLSTQKILLVVLAVMQQEQL